MSYEITIPDVPPSLNKTLNMHFRDRVKLKNNWKMWVRSQHMPAFGLLPERMSVTVTMHHSRLYDRDNAYGAVKPLVDALRHWRVIRDDTQEWLDLDVKQEKCPHKSRRTVIRIGVA